jgi:hypothetical protein
MNHAAVVARFPYRYQAEFARQILSGAGIRCALLADDAAGMYVGLTFTNPARLIVHEKDRDAALRLLSDHDVLGDDSSDGETGAADASYEDDTAHNTGFEDGDEEEDPW